MSHLHSVLPVQYSEFSSSQQLFSAVGTGDVMGKADQRVQYHSIFMAFGRREKGRLGKLGSINRTRISLF